MVTFKIKELITSMFTTMECIPNFACLFIPRLLTGIISFPTKAYSSEGDFDFITIGWGDKGFFLDTPTWAELKASTALNAAFLPSATALHVKYGKEPEKSKDVVKVYLSKKQYLNLSSYVKRSFDLKKNRVNLIANRGYGKSDNFYEARKSYHAFRTCNIWTNEALKAANIKTGIFALFPGGVIKYLKN